jgi:hypothetical protein
VVNITFFPLQITPQETLRPNRCSASRAISIRCWRVSSRNRRLQPSAASARSASVASASASGAAKAPITEISSRSSVTSGASANQSLGTRAINHPRSLSLAEAGEPSVAVFM